MSSHTCFGLVIVSDIAWDDGIMEASVQYLSTLTSYIKQGFSPTIFLTPNATQDPPRAKSNGNRVVSPLDIDLPCCNFPLRKVPPRRQKSPSPNQERTQQPNLSLLMEPAL